VRAAEPGGHGSGGDRGSRARPRCCAGVWFSKGLPMRVRLRISFKGLLPPSGAFDLGWRYGGRLLDDPVRDHDSLLFVEEVEHPILHSPGLGPELIDSIPEVV